MPLIRRFIACLFIMFTIASTFATIPTHHTAAQDNNGAVYFAETGFWVDPQFADFWRNNGGLTTFGYPISRVFYQDGLHRQYFERVIFEHHDQNDPKYQVLLVRLGSLNTVKRQQQDVEFQPVSKLDPPTSDARYYQETNHFLSGAFQKYWDSHGGLLTFGFPISETFYEPDIYTGNMQLVQYFERARMEYHPEKAGTEYEVLLGHLGIQELDKRVVPPLALKKQQRTPVDRDAAVIGPTPLFHNRDVSCGFNYAFWGDAANDVLNQEYLDLLQSSGCKWVRMQFAWRDIEVNPSESIDGNLWAYDRVVNLALERGLKILIDVTHAPNWARPADPGTPAKPAAFASFMNRLVTHFKGRIAAWQIWNEPNMIDENNGKINPAGYLKLARRAYPAIKIADPDALVVFPGLAPNSLMYDDWALDDDWYLETLFGLDNGEIANYFDVFGAHAYGAGNSPDTYWPGNLADNPGWTDAPEFYFRHLEEYHRILVSSGAGDKPIWITEMGWPTANSTEVYGYGAWITEELQAEYITRAFEIVRTEWDWVGNVFVWHLNTAPYSGSNSAFAGFSVTNSDGTARPAFNAIQEMNGVRLTAGISSGS